ncbi:MAG: PEP-CTERM sorting domain-containing protein [Tepidisphaerales bacterium]
MKLSMERRMLGWVVAVGCLLPAAPGGAAPLVSLSFVISSGAGQTGNSAATSAMVMSDGTSWNGAAVSVQGSHSTKQGGGNPLAANQAFKFSVGAAVDTLNATYGAGNWTITNPQLTVQYTLYSNNTRFGGGAGTFDVYWVAKDNWVQGTSNPIYAADAATLATWSTGQGLLASETFNWTTPGYTGTAADATTAAWVTDKSGPKQATVSYSLGLDAALLSDVTSATAGVDPNVSLYLMATSDTMGMTIFTGGGNTLPTLSFDVIAVPEPASLGPMGFAGIWLLGHRRRRVR